MSSPRELARTIGPLGLWSASLASLPPSELTRAAADLEHLGFGVLWIPESTWADPFTVAALALGATETLRVGTGVARIHGRTAQAMSNAWHGLSGWFPDRFILGLGVSHKAVVEAVHRASYDKPLTAMRAFLDDLEAARFDGAAPDADSAPTHLVLAALAPKMLGLAGERTDGAHPYLTPVSHTIEARRFLGPQPLLAPEVKVVFELDPVVARRIARRHLPLALPNYANSLIRAGFDPEAVRAVADDVVDALVAWGDDDKIHGQLHAHLAAGADHVAVQVLTAGGDPAPRGDWERISRLVPAS